MSIDIKLENIGKKYLITHEKKESYRTLRDTISENIKNIFKTTIKKKKEEFWALKNISFEVKTGERVGIIGRNGAGKSTLLKILSRITEPTTGKFTIRGRIASLLEVGTGFHPELTGRENIFLNGAILGMTGAEIKKKYDEIVAFAEVEKFLDTPVKRYSSGMYVRLAFSIAAHLEPDILLVDEVLAVGDAAFQKKCLGKMEEVSNKQGRTVFFVSHNIQMISSLCRSAILLNNGEIMSMGSASKVIEEYYSILKNQDKIEDKKKFIGDDTARFISARIINKKGKIITDSLINEEIIIEMDYEILKDKAKVSPNFHFFTSDGNYAFIATDTTIDPEAQLKIKKGRYRSRCIIHGNFFNDGTYYIGIALTSMSTSRVHFFEPNYLQLTVIDPIIGTVTRGNYVGKMPGIIRPSLKWKCEVIK